MLQLEEQGEAHSTLSIQHLPYIINILHCTLHPDRKSVV